MAPTREDFTREDDQVIVKVLLKTDSGWSGNSLYKNLAERNTRHTWQAWRNRYVKDKHKFHVLVKAEKARRRRASAQNGHQEVEESESEEEAAIPKPASPGKTPFTVEDDDALVKILIANPSSRNGNNIYQDLADENDRHTWQSWRNRYVKKKDYFEELIEKELAKRRKAKRIQKAFKKEPADQDEPVIRMRRDDVRDEQPATDRRLTSSLSTNLPPGRGLKGPTTKKPTSSATAAASGLPSLERPKTLFKSTPAHSSQRLTARGAVPTTPQQESQAPPPRQKPARSADRPPPVPVEDQMEEDEPEAPPQGIVEPQEEEATLTPSEEYQMAIILSTVAKGDARLLDHPFKSFAALAQKPSWQPYKAFYKRNRPRIDALADSLAVPPSTAAPAAPPALAPPASTDSSSASKKRPASSPAAASASASAPQIGPRLQEQPPKKKSRIVPKPAAAAAPSSPRYQPPSPNLVTPPLLATPNKNVPEVTATPASVETREYRMELSPEPDIEARLTGEMRTSLFKFSAGKLWRTFLGQVVPSSVPELENAAVPTAQQPAAQQRKVVEINDTEDEAEDEPEVKEPVEAAEENEGEEDEEEGAPNQVGVFSSLEFEEAEPVLRRDPPTKRLFREKTPESHDFESSDSDDDDRKPVAPKSAHDDDDVLFDEDDELDIRPNGSAKVTAANVIELPGSSTEEEVEDGNEDKDEDGDHFGAPKLQVGSSKDTSSHSGTSGAVVAAQLTPEVARQSVQHSASSSNTRAQLRAALAEPVGPVETSQRIASQPKQDYSSPDIARIFRRYEPKPVHPLVERRASGILSTGNTPRPSQGAHARASLGTSTLRASPSRDSAPSSQRRVTIAGPVTHKAPQPPQQSTTSSIRRAAGDDIAPEILEAAQRQIRQVQDFCERWGMSPRDALDLLHCCSGVWSLVEEYAQHMVGNPEIDDIDEMLKLARRLETVYMWSPEEDEALMLGTEKEVARLRKRKGEGALVNRRRYLQAINGGAGWKRETRKRFPFH